MPEGTRRVRRARSTQKASKAQDRWADAQQAARFRQEARQNICYCRHNGTGVCSAARTAVGNTRALTNFRDRPATISACARTGEGIAPCLGLCSSLSYF